MTDQEMQAFAAHFAMLRRAFDRPVDDEQCADWFDDLRHEHELEAIREVFTNIRRNCESFPVLARVRADLLSLRQRQRLIAPREEGGDALVDVAGLVAAARRRASAMSMGG